MSMLSEEDKAYILEAGASWDGKTVYDRIREINKNTKEAVDELIWIYENMENIRGCLNREFRSKYGDPNKRWEGKGSPKRPSFVSHHVISKTKMQKLLRLYILESEEVKRSLFNPRQNKQRVELAENRVEELKESLISTISEVHLEFE